MRDSRVPSTGEPDNDTELLSAARAGSMDAYAALYAQYFATVVVVARMNVDNAGDAEDIVAEAFQSVLQSVRSGRGPKKFFRAYLLSTVAKLSHHRNRAAARSQLTAGQSILGGPAAPADPVIRAFEAETVALDFQSLPERWKELLWYLDVQQMQPKAVAPILGLSPNAVSALGFRARKALRLQYLQLHISSAAVDGGDAFTPKLASLARGSLPPMSARKIRHHLSRCTGCRAIFAELRNIAKAAFRLPTEGEPGAPVSESLKVSSQVPWVNEQRPRYADLSWPDDFPTNARPRTTLS
ncbi:RNA polymerase sigma factor [Arthrobacter sp. KNU40]|uniref:RNA polymerase sigma factor n=1 Tax=Arthrobacter sp. KNU40 TaxID=3447965 RepID=UPI003F5F7BF7